MNKKMHFVDWQV